MNTVTTVATSRYSSLVPEPADGVMSNVMRIAGSPASPRNSAHSDQANADSVPSEISVSIVAAAWRRLAHAAVWNGHAPQTTTGDASVSAIHCQLSNCSAPIIDISSTGSDSAAEIAKRWASGSPAGAGSAVGNSA